jgi:Rod binding domain-containing protein
MISGPDIQSAMTMAKAQAPQAPSATNNVAVATKAAKQYEGVFISEFLGSMFEGIKTDGPFGGGQGEEMFRSLMIDQYGKSMEDQGGFGLSSAITRQLLSEQEKAH